MRDDLLDKLSTTQLQDLRHRLNQTDEATTLLVPVGPRAFRRATLRLDKLTWSTDPSPKHEEETYVSKAEALETLQLAINKRLPTKQPVSESESEDEQEKPSTQTPSKPSSPFIEIREEVDGEGKPLRAEAIDVTDHLQHLVGMESHGSEQHLGAPRDELTEQDSLPRPLANEDFEKLSARLDELAMMEETGEEPQPVPNRQPEASASPQKVPTARGWSKGFLNQPKKKKGAKKSHDSNDGKAPKGKTVSFGEDAVHEIPKEGNQNPLPSRQSRPIESNIFNGVVQERPRRKKSSEGVQTTKKLSRFAQERQQGLR